MSERTASVDVAGSRITLLDVGEKQYADAVLCQIAGQTVLIDGGHKGDDRRKAGHDSIPDQIRALTGVSSGPVPIDLLIVTHLHDDHIGCLPDLVGNAVVRCKNTLALDPKWRWEAAPDSAPDDAMITGARLVALALGEEPRSPALSDAELLAFLTDEGGLADRYRQMLDELARHGSLCLYGTDDHKPVEQAFKAIGLQILGPSKTQLQLTQHKINSDMADAFRAVSDALRVDAATNVADLYRQTLLAQSGASDALELMDGRGGSGAPINLQSIITLLRFDTRKALLTGDSQIVDPESKDPDLLAEVETLREGIETNAPYDFFKLPHHGSWNGFDQSLFERLGETRHFGISAGALSPAHPDPAVLDLLAEHRPAVQWARTDRNRRSTFSFGQQIRLKVERGRPNDARPNNQDVALASTPVAAPVATVVTASAKGEAFVEVITRISRVPAHVELSIRVDGQGALTVSPITTAGPQDVQRGAMPELHIAGGSPLPKMLVVTSRSALIANIGADETARVLGALRATANVEVFDQIPAGLTDAPPAVALVNAQVRQRPELEAVLILGGYDVVPAQRQDCLTPQLRQQVEAAIAADARRDYDDNIVWSDDVYAGGDPNDPLPRLPVSRIPDGASAALVAHALNASTSLGPKRSGIRNVRRPFAKEIFAGLPGSAEMGISAPLTYNVEPPIDISPWAYFMLHGSDRDATRFWGEDPDTGEQPIAFDINLVRQPAPEVVFAGCCWGALTVRERASELPRGRVPSPHGARDAISLAYLNAGAIGFVGCTGSHFSPSVAPYDYAGGPIHRAFWQARQSGRGPAQALFEAKVEYLANIPHGQVGVIAQAIEYKTFYEFTCLGLGW